MDTETNISAQAHRLRGVIAGLNDEIRAAERAIVNAEGEAKRIALHIVLGKATQADQENHRRDVQQARDVLADKQAIRDAAKEELRRLEHLEGAEKRALAEAEARKLVERRIDAARRIDEAARAMQQAWIEFDDLGDAIPNTGVQLRVSPSSMSQWETIRGHQRVDGALPSLFEKLHSNIIRAPKISSLAESEAALWRALLGE